MIKAIIFDCFGVFVGDAYRQEFSHIEHGDEKRALHIRDIRHAADRGFLTHDEAIQQLAPLLGVSAEELEAIQKKGEVLNLPLVQFAKELRARYKIALLSNVSSEEYLARRFAPVALEDIFDSVVASGDEGVAKPDIEIYERVAAKLGVAPEECVMIDDIQEFCDGARHAGMQAVRFISNPQCRNDIALLFDRGE